MVDAVMLGGEGLQKAFEIKGVSASLGGTQCLRRSLGDNLP